MNRRVLVIGMGRERYGDDAVGLTIARRVARRLGESATCVEAAVLDVLPDHPTVDVLALIDATPQHPRLPPGQWIRLAYPDQAEMLHACRPTGTHAVDLATTLRMAQLLGLLPGDTRIYAIAGEAFLPETDLSPALERRCDVIVREITADLRRPSPLPAPSCTCGP